MNNILELKARFDQKGNVGGGSRTLPEKCSVTAAHLKDLCENLKKIEKYWQSDDFLNGALISVYYDRVIAKSNRIHFLLKGKGQLSPNVSIVGAKFIKSENKTKHVITHYLTNEIIGISVHFLEEAIKIIENNYNGIIDKIKLEEIRRSSKFNYFEDFAKTNFINLIVDSCYIEKFDIDETSVKNVSNVTLVTLYKTDFTIKSLMAKLGINDYFQIGSIDESTVLLNPTQYEILMRKAPYLVAMAISDLRDVRFESATNQKYSQFSIPEPKNEPIIGVIDTLFDDTVYFSKWVEYTDLVPKEIEKKPSDKDHGTMVSSIIVDGPALNPDLDDECGRFRVKHFGVVAGKSYSSFTVIRAIKDIVEKNQDVKVWNLSLGSSEEVGENFISPEAAVLDELQTKYDITFVIAGTNKTKANQTRIGAPADSINGIVVNSVTREKKSASYTRKGPVLSFYTKPDLSYYGGEKGEEIAVYSYEKLFKTGTSFAAPWISRKLAYLIQVIGFSREIAKALIIDSAAGWEHDDSEIDSVGYGVVPVKISDILRSKDDEIRFLMTGTKELYDTYNYSIPVPVYKEKHPFIARATLCYYPKCFRNQGVDYTATEFQIQFGRMNDKGKIKPIDDDYQSTEGFAVTEEEARKDYRKWDNIKHIGEFLDGKKPKKAYNSHLWGISIKSKERLEENYGKGMKFGIVVTLKELNGKNRINDFIQACQMKSILVRQITIQTQVDIYNKIQEEIELE